MARRRQLQGATCAKSSKLVRGLIGAVVGGIGGALIGSGIYAMKVATVATTAPTAASASSFMKSMLLIPGLGLLGTGAGALIASHKSQC